MEESYLLAGGQILITGRDNAPQRLFMGVISVAAFVAHVTFRRDEIQPVCEVKRNTLLSLLSFFR